MALARRRRSSVLWAAVGLLLAAAVTQAQQDNNDQDANNSNNNGGGALEGDLDCQCVPYFLCDQNNRIIDNGQGLLDVRSSIPTCAGDIEVCCKVPATTDVTPSPQPQPQPQPQPDYPEPQPQPNPQPDYPEPQPQPQPQPQPNPQPDYPEPQPQPQPNPQPDYPEPQPQPRPNDHQGQVMVPQAGCGVKRVQTTSLRILTTEGTEDDTATHFAEFPWMLAVLVEEKISDGRPLNRFKCGASLITLSVAITAAHCIIGQEPSALKVRAGEWDTQSRSEPLPHQDRGVVRVLLHPEYRAGPLYNDVALVFLDAPFDLSDNVDTVCLPDPGEVFSGRGCYAAGWGRDSFGSTGAYQKILRKVELPMVANPECQSRLRQTRLGPFFRLHPSFVCAGGEEGRDTCQGDGGGPLVCPMNADRSRYAQVGIIAWGIGCGESTNPAVYASVAHAINWITNQIRQ